MNMNEETILLLKECNSGCKSATDSMEQVLPYVTDDSLKNLIEEYNRTHIKIGDSCHELLNNCGKDEVDPGVMAKAFSWVSTEMKLLMKNDSNQIAKIMMDGCNMGIQSVTEYINKSKNASEDAINLANHIVQCEEEFMDKLKTFL